MYTRTGPVQKHTGAPTVARARIKTFKKAGVCACIRVRGHHRCTGTLVHRYTCIQVHRDIGTKLYGYSGASLLHKHSELTERLGGATSVRAQHLFEPHQSRPLHEKTRL